MLVHMIETIQFKYTQMSAVSRETGRCRMDFRYPEVVEGGRTKLTLLSNNKCLRIYEHGCVIRSCQGRCSPKKTHSYNLAGHNRIEIKTKCKI